MTEINIQSESILLGLRGEIRNYIYHLSCTTSAPITLCPTANSELDWQSQKRQSLSLTQTCRQVRAEFRPIFMRRHTFEIPFEKANENLSAFLIGKGVDCKGTYIKVVLTTQDMKGPSENGADILPLIKAYAKSPCFCIVMRESRYMDTTERTLTRKQRNGFLKKLFVKGGKSLPTGPCANSTWLRYMRTAMNALFICRGPTRFVLTFQVNHVFAEDWMEGGEDLDADKKKRWVELSGLQMEPIMYKVEVKEWAENGRQNWDRSWARHVAGISS